MSIDYSKESMLKALEVIRNHKPAEPEFVRWVSSREAFDIVKASIPGYEPMSNKDTNMVAFGIPIFIYESDFKATEFAWKFSTQFVERVLLTKIVGGKFTSCIIDGKEIEKQTRDILNPIFTFDFEW